MQLNDEALCYLLPLMCFSSKTHLPEDYAELHQMLLLYGRT